MIKVTIDMPEYVSLSAQQHTIKVPIAELPQFFEWMHTIREELWGLGQEKGDQK